MEQVKVTERDELILREIDRWRTCGSRHIRFLANFSGQRATDRRLKILIDAGYIERKKYLYGVPSIYFLTSKGTIYAIVGNGIFSIFVLVARLFLLLLDWVQCALTGKHSIFSAFMLIFKLYFEFCIWFLNFGLQVILSVNSRKNEFKADLFSYSIGYDSDMIEALYLLEKISLGDNSSIIQKMIASHPRITLRIKKLEELDDILMK